MISQIVYLVLSFLLSGAAAVDWDAWTPLDQYVWAVDGFFSWEELTMYTKAHVNVYILNMTSQKWFNESHSNHPVWHHQLIVAIPKQVTYPDHGLLIIGGGNNDWGASSVDSDPLLLVTLCTLAASTVGAVVSLVSQIPNQPVVFTQDPTNHNRSENSFISWTWKEFVETNGRDPEMLAQMPMTKAAKRALDATEEFVLLKTGVKIQKFTVTGASKRGWTTWSLAAVDQRVVAIAPIVMDLLNIKESMMHHFRSLGGAWSFALADFYYDELMLYLTEPIFEETLKHEDPFSFKERLTIPKLVICATGDVFFLLTDSHYWWDEMPGNNWIMMNPKVGHMLSNSEPLVVENVLAFWKSIITDFPIPKLTWSVETSNSGNTLTLTSDSVPLTVHGYSAVTLADNDRRDFRWYAGEHGSIVPQPVMWTKHDVTVVTDFEYQFYVSGVQNEWVGAMIQATFNGPDGMDLTFSTEVEVYPDTFPADACEGHGCKGRLV